MNGWKWIKIFVILSFLCLAFIAGVGFIVDPLKLFHKPYFFKDKLNFNMRLQASGIIRNYEFDSIILGTSILENTSSSEASKILGGDFFNISLSGSDFFERSFVLNYALEKKKIKKVIYSLDYIGLVNSKLGHKTFPIDSFDYLYDNNYLNDFKQYLNLNTLPSSIRFAFSKKTNFDTPNEWFSVTSQASRFGGIDNWFKDLNNTQINNAYKGFLSTIDAIKNKKTIIDTNIEEKITASEKYLKKYLLEYVKNNPNTEFNLIIPPYSRILNAINAQYKKSEFIRIKKSIKFLVENSEKYPNLKIYGWGDKDFPNDISLYKDLTHYHPKINSKMLYWIKENDGLLTLNNIEKYLEVFEKKSLDYDLLKIGKKIETFLHKH